MLSNKGGIVNFAISGENENFKNSSFNSPTSKTRAVLSTSYSIMTGKSDDTDTSSAGLKNSPTTNDDKNTLELKYGGNDRHSPQSNSIPSSSFNLTNTFNLSADAIKQLDVHKEAKTIDTLTKRRHPSSYEDSIFQPDSKKYITLSDLSQIAENYKDISSTVSNLMSLPDITFSELFTKELNSILSEEDKENILLTEQQFNATEAISFGIVEERKFSSLGLRKYSQGDSKVLKEVDSTFTFKIPEKRARTKTLSSKIESKAANGSKKMKNSEDSKCKADKNVESETSQNEKESFNQNPAINMMLNNENSSHVVLESGLDLEYLSEFQNLSNSGALVPAEIPEVNDRSKTSRSRRDAGEVSPSRSNPEKVSRSRRDSGDESRSRRDSGDVSRSRRDSLEVSRSRRAAREVSRSRRDSREVSRSRRDSGEVSRSRRESGEVSRYRKATREVFQSDIAFVVDPRHEEYRNSLAPDAKKIENLILNTLDALQQHIHFCHCELNAIPAWSPTLSTVLHNLAKRRDLETCNYLAVRHESESRIPLFKVREYFLGILETVVYAMTDILDDLRYILSYGNIQVDTSITDKAKSFWYNTVKVYNEMRDEFYHIRDDYPNFQDVCESMDEHFNRVKEMFFTFNDSVIDLFETL